ncbi:phosphotransferase [Candidatus Poriferisocius sp.]|uniref:phosphotransferase n=1 Tax=Candidatus Poriferisocius sp. TaxID=3101276 RepID=UPI003B5A3568
MSLPSHPEAITPDWLNEQLSQRHPGAVVTAVEVLAVHAGTNANARLGLTYHGDPGLPATMFAKLPPLDPDRRAQINQTGMGRREALFYQRLAHRVPMETLTPYVAAFDDDTGAFVLLLEDLENSAKSLPDPIAGVSVDYAATAMDHFGELHARYESADRRAAEADWVPPANRGGSDYGARLLRYGLDHHRDKLSDAFAEISELYIHHTTALHRLWVPGEIGGPATLLQGDGHIGNLFVTESGGPGFLDWGLVNVGAPMRDVSYFLNMSLDPADRRRCDRDLIGRYLDARTTHGAQPISYDDAWLAHRIHAAYTVPASCQVVTFPDDASEGRRRFAAAFLARAEAALADLDPLPLLRDALTP